MYKEIEFSDHAKALLEQLQKGAFLTVKAGDRVNTMTIAWGSLGFMWNKPMFTAMVRHSRYTYELIEKAESFTVSFPLDGQLKKELGICGTKSGRDMDKIKECRLTLKEGSVGETVVIDECDLHIECQIVYKQEMNANALNQAYKDALYADDNYHALYFGEIIKTYVKEKN